MWNVTAFVQLFVGIGAGFLSWIGLSHVLGETDVVQGVSFVLGGLAISAVDIILRWSRGSELGKWRFVSPESGGWAVFVPMWVIGIIGLVGGVVLIFGES